MKDITRWLGHEFMSSSETTEEFKAFSSELRKEFKKIAEVSGWELEAWSRGHFYVSGFFRKGNKFVYFMTQDVRDGRNHWYNKVLYRAAKDTKDFRGGANYYAPLDQLARALESADGICDRYKETGN